MNQQDKPYEVVELPHDVDELVLYGVSGPTPCEWDWIERKNAEAHADELNAAFAAGRQGEWLSVKEHLPKELDMMPGDCHHVYVWAWDKETEEAVKIKAYHVEDPKRRKDFMYSHWMYYFAPSAPK